MSSHSGPQTSGSSSPTAHLLDISVSTGTRRREQIYTGSSDDTDSMAINALSNPPSASSTGSEKAVKSITDEQLIVQSLNSDGTPRRPMNAFMIFARRRRPQVSAANQAMRTGEISKILSREWANMPMSDKEFYLEQAKRLKDTFNSKYPDYVYRRRPNNSRKKRKGDGAHELAHDPNSAMSADPGEDSSDTVPYEWPSPDTDDFPSRGPIGRHVDTLPSPYLASPADYHPPSSLHVPSQHETHAPPQAHSHSQTPAHYDVLSAHSHQTRIGHLSHSPTIPHSPAPYLAQSYSYPAPAPDITSWRPGGSSHAWPPPLPSSYPLRGQRSSNTLSGKIEPSQPPQRPWSTATSAGSPSTPSSASVQALTSSSPFFTAQSPASETYLPPSQSFFGQGAYGSSAPAYDHGYSVPSSAPSDGPSGIRGSSAQLPRSLSSSHPAGTASSHVPYGSSGLHHVGSSTSGAIWDRAGDR